MKKKRILLRIIMAFFVLAWLCFCALLVTEIAGR